MKTSIKQLLQLTVILMLLSSSQFMKAQVACASGQSCQDIRLRFTSITTGGCNAPSGQPDPQLHITNNTNGGANYFGWANLPNNATTNISALTPSCTSVYPENVGITCGQGSVNLTIISSEVDGPFCLNPNGTSNTSTPMTVTVDLSNITATGSVSGTWNFFPLGGCFSINYEFVCMSCAPEINVQGNSITILDGDVTPSLADHTQFLLTGVNGNSSRVFTIQNTGGSALPISSIASSNGLFTVSGAPSSVPVGGSANFAVTFSPTANGTYNSAISINNGDCNEGIYDFVVSGQSLTPFTCTPAFYQIRNGNQLAVYNPMTGDLSNIGPPNIGCNAAGYNLQDNFAYALHEISNPSFFTLLRIDATGNASEVAVISFPSNVNPNAGDCDLSGNWYLTHLYDMYKVNIAAAMAIYPATYNVTPYTLSFPDGAVQGNNDAAFNANDGKFYTIDGYTGFLAVLDFTGPTSAVVNRIPMSGPITALTTGAGFGSVWCDANGDFFAFHNTTGEYYKVNIATGVSLLVSSSSTQAFNDGFSCATAANPLPCAMSVDATALPCVGGNYDLQLLVQYNNPPAGSTGFSLTVNGVNQGTFPFANFPSGSVVTIPNLLGNGTQNIPVVVQMNGNGCGASTTYNAPNCCPSFMLPANGNLTVACPAQATLPTPPVVLDASGAPVTPSGPTVTNNPSPLSCEGTRTYTWTYTNCSGSQNWSFVYTIEREPFSINTPNGAATIACLAQATLPMRPVVGDNCNQLLSPTGPVITDSPNPLTCEGTRTFAWTYTDCEGNSAVWSFVYTIERNDFTMPANGAATVACPALATQPTPPVVLSDCGETIAPTGPVVSATPACEGTKTYTWTYTDCEGNSNPWVFTYTIERNDFTMPASGAATVACPALATQPTPPVVLSNCGETIAPTGPVVSATPACEGTKTYTWTYTDCEGNSHPWVFIYTIERNGFTVPANGAATVACPDQTDVQPTPPVVLSNCGEVLAPVVSASAKNGCEGNRNWYFTYTDCEGNTATWVFTYTVEFQDFAVPASESHGLECASYAWVATPPFVYDNCGKLLNPTGPAITSTNNAQGCEASRSYTWTYKDCEGNSHQWSSSFTFTYAHDFDIYPSKSSDVTCISYAVMPIPPTVYDWCGNAAQVKFLSMDEELSEGGCQGIRVYHFVYSDCGGHSHPWSMTYFINDNEAPLGICPSGAATLGGVNVNVTNLSCINEVPCPDDHDFSQKIEELLEAGNFFDVCNGTDLVVELDSWTALWDCADPDGDGVNTFGRTFYFRIADKCGNEYPDVCSVTYSGICTPITAFPQETWGINGEGGGVNLGLIQQLLGQGPLVIGGNTNSVTITQAQCVVDLLPGIGGPSVLSNCHQLNCQGCNPAGQNGMKNVLATNTIALTLNMRMNGPDMDDQSLGCMYVHPCIANCEASGSCVLQIFDSNGSQYTFPYNIGGLLKLANKFLSGDINMNSGQQVIYGTAINEALNSVNGYWSQSQSPNGCNTAAGAALVDNFAKSLPNKPNYGNEKPNFEIWPNPANREITLHIPSLPMEEDITLKCYNAFGQKVLEQQFGNRDFLNERIDLTQLNNGVYIISVKIGTKHFEQKLVVSKS